MRFISFLNTKTASVICLLIAVVCRVTNIIFVSFIGRDKIIVMQHSRNLLEGKGLSIARYYIENLETPVYDFTPYWPPGYPILLAPFLKIFNYDTYWATTASDIFFGIAFVLVVRKIVQELNFPVAAVNIITLIAGCFDYPFIYKSLPTDISAFVFFLIGILLLLKIVRNEKFQVLKLIAASVFLFIPCTIRYSYPPLTISAPIAIIFLGFYLKNKMLLKKGSVILLLVAALITCFLLALKTYTGSAGYIVETKRGFFPENFLHWTPFIIQSFINTIFLISQFVNRTGLSVEQNIFLFEIVNAILFVGLLSSFVYLFFKTRFFKTITPFSSFLLIGLVISAATCISLSYLTITYQPQLNWGNYLTESRYFMFINLFLQMAFIGWIFLYSSWKKSFFQKAVIVCFSCILFIEIAHNIYFDTKVITHPGKYHAPDEEPDYIYFISLMNSLGKENPDADICVVSDNDDFFPLATNYLGYKGVYDGNKMLKELPKVKKKTILILALYDLELNEYRPFIAAHNGKFLKMVSWVYFYRIDLTP
jgi:hypothetical protein